MRNGRSMAGLASSHRTVSYCRCVSYLTLGAVWRMETERHSRTVRRQMEDIGNYSGKMHLDTSSWRSAQCLHTVAILRSFPARADQFSSRGRRESQSIPTGGAEWEAEVQKSSSWRHFLPIERSMRTVLDVREYDKFVEACEKQFVNLHLNGASPVKTLCRYANFWREGGNWQALSLAVGCAARLAKTNVGIAASLHDLSNFVFEVSLYKERRRTRPERLQSVVNSLERNMDQMSSRYLLRGVFGASRIGELKVAALMSGVERLYCESLGDLPSKEVEMLLSASARVSTKSQGYNGAPLCLRFLTEHWERLKNFPPSICVNTLASLTFSFRRHNQIRSKLVMIFHELEDKLSREIAKLSDDTASRLCNSLQNLRVKSEVIPVQFFLIRRMPLLSPVTLTNMFEYAAKHQVIQTELLHCLLNCMTQTGIEHWDYANLNLFLTSLTYKTVRCNPVTKQLAAILNGEVEHRLACNRESFPLSVCVNLFYCFQFLKINASPTIDVLFSKSVRNIEALSLRDLCLIVQGVGYLKNNAYHVYVLSNAVQKKNVRCGHLTLQACSVLCKGFVAMRLAEAVWLKDIAEACKQFVSLLMSNDHVAIVVSSLSMLCVCHETLFQDIGIWLDAHSADVPVAHWDRLIKCLWACTAQNIFPVKALQQLSGLDPSSVVELSVMDMINLLQVDLLWTPGQGILQTGTRTVLLLALKNKRDFYPHHVLIFTQMVASFFPAGHVRQSVCTAEGCRVNCLMLIGQGGESVKWPAGVPEDLSKEDVRKLVTRGCQPLAVLMFASSWFSSDSNKLLGPAQMMCQSLNSCGLQVLVIPTAACKATADANTFLRARLRNFGLRVPPERCKLGVWRENKTV